MELKVAKATLPLTKWQLFANMASLLHRCDFYKIKKAMATEKHGTSELFMEMQVARRKFLKLLKNYFG